MWQKTAQACWDLRHTGQYACAMMMMTCILLLLRSVYGLSGGDQYPITGSIVHVSECLLGSRVSVVTGWWNRHRLVAVRREAQQGKHNWQRCTCRTTGLLNTTGWVKCPLHSRSKRIMFNVLTNYFVCYQHKYTVFLSHTIYLSNKNRSLANRTVKP